MNYTVHHGKLYIKNSRITVDGKMDENQRKVLEKLYKKGKIGGAHCSKDDVPKGFPPGEIKAIRIALEELIRDNYVLPKPTHSGLHVSINPKRLKEVKEILSRE